MNPFKSLNALFLNLIVRGECAECGGVPRRRGFGVSLIELGLVMAIVSIALVPVVKMMSGPSSSSGEGSVDRITAMKSKEAILANAMVEKILAGDFSEFSCDSAGNTIAFNPNTDLPTNGGSRVYSRCANRTYSTPLYYQWSIQNVTGMPKQNQYYQGTFNVYQQASGGTPILTLPANFFRNIGAVTQSSEKIGIIFAMDVSGSMVWGRYDGYLYSDVNNFSSPYMFYRYDRNRFTGSAWGTTFSPASVPGMLAGTKRAWLNMWNDSELDMSYAQSIWNGSTPDFSDPDSLTVNNEKFPYSRTGVIDTNWGEGLLGIGDCRTSDSTKWSNDPNLRHSFLPVVRNNSYTPDYYTTYRSPVRSLCNYKASTSDWGYILDDYMSRIEAVRTGALSLLLNLEQNSDVVKDLELGFIPWANEPQPQHLVSMEPAVSVPGVSGLHFANMRQKLLWINRADPSSTTSALPVVALGGTYMRAGMEAARAELMSKDFDRRIMILFTDGEPSDATALQMRDYVLNTFGNNAPQSQRITLFTVGLIGADATTMANMANSTPDGQSFTTSDLRQLRNIFESISYQIQKLSLLNTADRYEVTL